MTPPQHRPPNFLSKILTSIKSLFKRAPDARQAPPSGGEKWSWGDVGWFASAFGVVAVVATALFPALQNLLTSGSLFRRVGVIALYVGVSYGVLFLRFLKRQLVTLREKVRYYDAIWDELQAQRQFVAALRQQMAADHQFEVLKVQFYEGEMRILLGKGTGATKLSVGQKLTVLDVSDGQFMATLEIREETQARYGAVALQLDPLWNGYIRECARGGNRETEPPFQGIALFVANPEAPEING